MNYTLMTILGMTFIWLMTSVGAMLVLIFKGSISQRVNSIFLGFASGIMVASSVWSLIVPSIEAAAYMQCWSFVPAALGIVLGSLLIIVIDQISTKYQENQDIARCKRLFLAVTVHNVPEGLAVGFAFGMAYSVGSEQAYILAMGLAFGIGIQNLPEGAAVALPIKSATGSRVKGLLYGIISGVVEPIFAVMGYFLAAYLLVLQPWLLAFAAGAMLYVVVSDLMREAHAGEPSHVASISFIVGFIIMMILDVVLG